ncbi:MAG: hypothetical protein M3O65_05615, partial [Actinomycetota bacterium]|nr:hypothetical protein [Actinomycetota bacterium]
TEAVMVRLDRLYDRLKARFAGDGTGRLALERLAEQPEDPRRQASLQHVLAQALETDPRFAAELVAMVGEIRAAAPALTMTQVNVSQSGATAAGGGDVRMSGETVAGRDITINEGRRSKPNAGELT